MKKCFSLLLIVLLLFVPAMIVPADQAETTDAAAAAFPAGDPKDVAAVILHTNDVHVGYQDNIGYDGLALYKKELQKIYDHVLLVDAGDAIQGAALGALSKGAEIIKMMNEVGYDLAIPGNHEFDFGFDVLDDCAEKLSCGYTCANFCTADEEPVFKPWRILEAGDLKIGFVGAVTPDTFTRSAIKDIVDEVGQPMYDFLADRTGDRLGAALQQRIDEVRANGADKVILVAHLGSKKNYDSIYSSNAIAAKLTGLDAVIDGHTHEIYNTQIPDKEGNMIPIAQVGTKLPKIGQLTIYKDGHLEETLVDPVPLLEGIDAETAVRKDVERAVDPATKTFLDGITKSYARIMDRKVGTLAVDLIKMDDSTDYSRTGENGLCDLVADAFRVIGNADASLIVAGTVRTNLLAGDVACRDIINILPYCNKLITVRVGGRTIRDALESGVSFLPKQSGGFLQVSGLTYTIDESIDSSVSMDEKQQFISVDGARRVSDVTIGGKPLDPNGSYTFAINDYLLTGGNGYMMFKDAEIVSDPQLADNETLISYIERCLNGVIPAFYEAPQGRITKKTAA